MSLFLPISLSKECLVLHSAMVFILKIENWKNILSSFHKYTSHCLLQYILWDVILLKGALPEKLSNFSYVFCKFFRKISRKFILPEELKTMRNFVRNFAKNSRIFCFILRTDCEKMRNFPKTIFPFRIRPFSPCKDGVTRLHFTTVMYISLKNWLFSIVCFFTKMTCVFLQQKWINLLSA